MLLVGAVTTFGVATGELAEVVPWTVFKTTFNKTYCSDALETAARAAFDANVAFIQQHNAEEDAGLHGYRCGVNQASARSCVFDICT